MNFECHSNILLLTQCVPIVCLISNNQQSTNLITHSALKTWTMSTRKLLNFVESFWKFVFLMWSCWSSTKCCMWWETINIRIIPYAFPSYDSVFFVAGLTTHQDYTSSCCSESLQRWRKKAVLHWKLGRKLVEWHGLELLLIAHQDSYPLWKREHNEIRSSYPESIQKEQLLIIHVFHVKRGLFFMMWLMFAVKIRTRVVSTQIKFRFFSWQSSNLLEQENVLFSRCSLFTFFLEICCWINVTFMESYSQASHLTLSFFVIDRLRKESCLRLVKLMCPRWFLLLLWSHCNFKLTPKQRVYRKQHWNQKILCAQIIWKPKNFYGQVPMSVTWMLDCLKVRCLEYLLSLWFLRRKV